MKFLSLFAGVGGLDIGLERAGMTCIGQVEWDDYATRVLEKHWPAVPRFKDITDERIYEWLDTLGEIDLVCGGFPCQDISNAGKRAGIKGERSSLWGEMLRCINLVRPRYALVENVAALLGRGMGRVLGDLSEIGFDSEWHCIPAAAVGAPHIRDRVFIVAYPVSIGREPWPGSKEAPEIKRRTRSCNGCRNANAGDIQVSEFPGLEGTIRSLLEREIQRGYHANTTGSGRWATEPELGRVAHGIPSRVDRLKCLGNAVVPQVAEVIGRAIMEQNNE